MLRMVLGATAFAVPVTITVLDVFGYVAKVEGASMQPCLNPDNDGQTDYVLLNRWNARKFEFERGEVIALSCPRNSEQKIIKRIIGLQGDTIKTLSYKNRYVRVPEGHCWIEGDHHGQSMDSNFFGPVPLGLINAKASHIVWPPHRWQEIPKHVPDGRINVKRRPRPDHILDIMEELDKLDSSAEES